MAKRTAKLTTKSARNSRPVLEKVSSLVFNSPLAIEPRKLAAILHGVGDRFTSDPASLHSFLDSGVLPLESSLNAHEIDAEINAYWDDDDDEETQTQRPYTLIDGVAVIPVQGTLMDTGGWMSALSGCSSYEGITKALKMAMDEDSSVRGVLFKLNSPGGSTNGCFELCDLIYSYRGKKPMYAVAKHLAASAAYAIASAADKVFVSMTGGVGSIGVFALHCDMSGMDAENGLKYTYIQFGAKKTDGNPHEPLSKSASSDLQFEVDRQGMMFVERVARNRGVSSKKIMDTQAAVFCGVESQPLLADQVGTYETALAELSRKVLDRSATLSTGRSATTETKPVENVLNTKTDATIEVDGKTYRLTPVDATAAPITTSAKTESCSTCNGSGKVDGKECSKCSGSGKVDIGEDLGDDGDEDDAAKATKVVKAAALVPPTPIAAAPPTPPAPSSEANANVENPAKDTTMENTQIQKDFDELRLKASADAAKLANQEQIMDLCAIAGDPNAALDFIRKGVSVEDVKKDLKEKAIAKSSTNPLGVGFGSPLGGGAGSPLMTLHQAVEAAVQANINPNILPSQILSRVIRANPALYEAYQDERQMAALIPSHARKYVEGMAASYPSLGLSGARG